MMKKRDVQERPGLGRRLCYIAVLGIVLAMGFGIVIDIMVPDVLGDALVVSGVITPGTIGSTATLSPSDPYTDLVILNDSSFSPESGWKTEFSRISDSAPRVRQSSTASGIQLDFSNVIVSYYYEMNINLRDYENVTVSVDVTTLRGPVEVDLDLGVFSFLSVTPFTGYSDGKSFPLTTGEKTTVNIKLDTKELYTLWTPLWLAQSYVRLDIYPVSSNWYDWEDTPLDASLLLENVTISAVSTTPLSPLKADIQDTQGSSAYEYVPKSNWLEWPAVNLTIEEIPNKWGLFVPSKSNDTIYVPAGNYSGIAGFYNYNHSNYTFGTSFEVLPGTALMLGLRFEMVRVDLSVSPAVPYLRISMSYSNYSLTRFGIEVVPPFPSTFYIPKRTGFLYISILTPPRVGSSEILYAVRIEASHPVSLEIHLRIPMFSFFGIMLSIGELLFVILSLALLMGVVLGHLKPNPQHRLIKYLQNPHFWPVILVSLSTLVPWFSSSWDVGQSIIVQRSLYVPFALGLDTTTHSLAALVVSPLLLLDIPFRIVFLWLPLRWAFGYIGSPVRWSFNLYYAICICLPLLNGVMFYLYTPMPLAISTGFLLVMVAPILWGLEILIYRGFKRVKK